MVSGGSGITPFMSIIRELIFRSTTGSPTPSVLLICAFKTSADLTMLDLLLPVSSTVSDLSRLRLRIKAFVTRESVPPNEPSKLIRTAWFISDPSDLPLAPVLGRDSWLWLGAIISASFVAFLVLVGIVTRYYLYPIENGTNGFFSSWKSLLNLLFICICIVVTSTAAVLWNKKRSTMKAKIQNTEALTDRELESVPHQLIVGATTVHFGERPDFKSKGHS